MSIFTNFIDVFFKKLSVLLFLVACLTAQQLYAGYPSMVLDGTNIKEASEYTFSCSDPKAGDYETETGGATIWLEIRKKGKTFQVRRQFIEPGVMPQNKVYKNFRRNKRGVFETKGACLRVTCDGGVLLLELSSGIDAITDTMWTYFGPEIQEE
ncbi:MAG: hypothetical protein WCA04_05450 [Geobacteraceae bacterium]